MVRKKLTLVTFVTYKQMYQVYYQMSLLASFWGNNFVKGGIFVIKLPQKCILLIQVCLDLLSLWLMDTVEQYSLLFGLLWVVFLRPSNTLA